MNFSSLLNLIFQAFGAYETGLAEIEAGQPAVTPTIQVGTTGGKPLYAFITLTTTK